MWKSALSRCRRSIDGVVQRTRFERDLRDELQQHLDARTRDLRDGGLSPADAARQARIEFGAIERYKEMCRDERGFDAFRPLHGLGGDIRLAARRLAATPQFFVFATLSLAVGVGVTTAVFSIIYSVVWRPIGFSDPSGVVFVAAPGRSGPVMRALLTDRDFRDLRQAQRTLAAVAAARPLSQPLVAPTATDFVAGEAVSGDYFRVTGLVPQRGRWIGPEDDRSAAAVIVLSDRTWRTRFDADAEVIGRVVRFAGRSFEIIGVAPPRFEGIEPLPSRTGLWIPLGTADALPGGRMRIAGSPERPRLTVLGRLAPGATAAHAADEIAAIARRLDESRPLRLPDGIRNGVTTYTSKRPWSARTADDPGSGAESKVASLVIIVVALVLGVACTNLANLMLARGAARQQEFAVRRALGASRWHLVRELFVEGGLVAVAGGASAVVLLVALLRLATVEIPLQQGVFTIDPSLNVPALAVTALALGVSMLVFGLEPALQLTRGNVTADLAGGPAAVGVPRSRRQQAFIRWQVAVSAAFFLAAAVLVNLIVLELRHDSGIDLDRLGVATVHFGMQEWDEDRATRALARTAEELRGHRGIESVAFSSGAPFGLHMTPFAAITTPDRPFVQGARSPDAYLIAATPDIFRTFGVDIVGGRAFDLRDDKAAPRVMVISERTARAMFGTRDALARQLVIQAWGRAPAETYTVIGIARETDTGEATKRKDNAVYVPLAQHFERNVAIFARTHGEPADAARAIQLAVRRVDPDLGIGTAGPASLILAGEFLAARIAAAIASALGLLTLAMSMVGLYGIQSHVVARRTREVGVRMAIGASAAQIRKMILREGYRPVMQGLALGLFFGVLVRLLLRATVNGQIDVFDPLAFVLVPVPLIAAAFVACYLPARRASRVDPNEALRHI